jgi:DNA-binding transcriptional LysR family regulator
MSHDLNETLMFVKVVELGSFTAAGLALGVPKATLSRKMNELEQRLGVLLLKRTTRRLGLTEAGTVYFQHCARIARDLDEAESAISQLNETPRGWLRVAAPYGVGTECIAPLLPAFLELYPDIRIETLFTNDQVDVVASEWDLVVRGGALPDSSLSARRLYAGQWNLYATPAYFMRYGEPVEPPELLAHRAIVLAIHRRGNAYIWPLRGQGETVETTVKPVLVANDPVGAMAALMAGVGIMMIGEPFVQAAVKQGRLRRVLPAWSGPTIELNALFPPGRLHAPKVRVFVDFLIEHLDVSAVGGRILLERTPQ